MELPRLENVELSGKRVFLRVDFNVPIENGKVTDKTRIEKTLPTIELLIKKGARIVIASHLGRPKGQVNSEFSMAPVVEAFQGLVKANVLFSKTVIGDDAVKRSKELKDGEILVIENVRFHKEEEENEAGFSKKLAALADVYVNDAFGAAHRAHASTEGIAHLLPSYAGLLMHKEIVELSALLAKPARPFVAIIGGSKVSTKIKVLTNLFDKVNHLLIGGGMAYTFLKSRAIPVGNSLVEKDFEVQAFQLIEKPEWPESIFNFPWIISSRISSAIRRSPSPWIRWES